MQFDDKVKDALHLRGRRGEYGIEVEVEGVGLPFIEGDRWSCKEDHSLRGGGTEYVFESPLVIEDCRRALVYLEERLTAPDVRIRNSHRTSVHVHRNVLNDTVRDIYTLIALYYILEAPLTEFAGPSRVGNMYCLRASDAEYLPFQVVQSVVGGELLNHFHARDDIRYSGLNLTALHRFGSVEYRAFRGTIKAQEIMEWVDTLEALHKAAKGFRDPLDVSQTFFRLGPEAFLERVMPDFFVAHVKNFTDYQDTMLAGHQYTFEIAHAVENWHWRIEQLEMPQPKPGRWQFINRVPQFDMPQAIRDLINEPPQVAAPEPLFLDEDDDQQRAEFEEDHFFDDDEHPEEDAA